MSDHDETERKRRRDSALEKIRALLRKTVENGATEAEAMAAASKAEELIAKYDVETTELDIKESAFASAASEFDYTDITTRRSEEHTSELQSLMRISYAVF